MSSLCEPARIAIAFLTICSAAAALDVSWLSDGTSCRLEASHVDWRPPPWGLEQQASVARLVGGSPKVVGGLSAGIVS
eukprot:9492084-Pyramimonas_sp.AAC.2